jgi:GAF domain-containing protein
VISAVADSDEHQVRRVVLLSDVELRRKDREMWHQANFDRLTGLPNRALLADRIDGMLRRARRNHTEVAVLFIDLDDFKPVNDDFGHDVGDLLLREVAAACGACSATKTPSRAWAATSSSWRCTRSQTPVSARTPPARSWPACRNPFRWPAAA